MEENNNSMQSPSLHIENHESDQPTHSITSEQSTNNSIFSTFVIGEDDIPPIRGVSGFLSAFKKESSKLWHLGGPAILTALFQYGLGAITQTFAGHVGTLDLAAFSIANAVISGLCLGITMGMGSALETLCGQAYGAGQVEMLGVYMQRSWIIVVSTSSLLMLMYVFAEPLLLLLQQPDDISRAAGQFARWMIPQLYAYSFYFPITKFLQAQSKIAAMAWISGLALVLHAPLSWLLMIKLEWGMAGGILVLNGSWWFMVVALMIYIWSGTCGKAWTGFSFEALKNLWSFVKLSAASAVMLCLEIWYYTALILFAGYLANANVAVDALSICVTILGLASMTAIGFNAAISVRVSNELGAGHPRAAKFSVVVVVISAFAIALLIAAGILIFRAQYPPLFSKNSEVQHALYKLSPFLAFCILLNNVQPALSGVAIGAGWQALVAYVNIGCYYVFGVPLGLILGIVLKKGVQGLWSGMVVGTIVQTLILIYLVYKTNWNKEASAAASRIKMWGGAEAEETDLENGH